MPVDADRRLAAELARLCRGARGRHVEYARMQEIYRGVCEAVARDEATLGLLSINTCIGFFGEWKRERWVREMLARMLDLRIQPDIVTFTGVVKAAGDADAALAVHAMTRRCGLVGDVVYYTALLSTVGRYTKKDSRRADLMAQVWRAMRDDGVEPSALTYNTYLAAVASFDEVVAVLDEMDAGGLPASQETYTSAIVGLGSATERSVNGVLQIMLARGDERCITSGFLSAVFANVPHASLGKYLQLAPHYNVPIDVDMTLSLLRNCLRAAHRRGDPAAQLAEQVLQQALMEGSQAHLPAVFTMAMRIYEKTRNLDGANALVKHIKGLRVRPTEAFLALYTAIEGHTPPAELGLEHWRTLAKETDVYLDLQRR